MRALLIAVPLMLASVSAYACKTEADVQAKGTEMQQAMMAAMQKNPTGVQTWTQKLQGEAMAKAEEAKKDPSLANDYAKGCAYIDEKIAELKALAK